VNENTDPAHTEGELLKFPTDYPIKVVGRSEATLRARIDSIVLRHVPDVTPERISERPSGQGNFVSITYMIIARSREQIVALVQDLAAADGVMMVI
jgi:putative lipoic acid-binding regulatory protein